jgi:hypothetical protein
MAKNVNRRTAAKLPTMGQGKHPDGGGLYFQVMGNSRTWVYRYKPPGAKNSRYIGLAAYPAVTLKQAREKVGNLKTDRATGIDPING